MNWQCFIEIVQVITQIITTVVVVFGAWIAYKTFLRESVQEPEPTKAGITEAGTTVPSEVKVFETSDQSTLLRITDKGLECHLNDKRPGKHSGHQWTLTKSQAKEIMSKRDYRVYPGYQLRSGLFSIGPRTNWLYSKRLYPEPALLELEIQRLLEKVSI